MNKSLSWYELLILTGYQPEILPDGSTICRIWDEEYKTLLNCLLDGTNTQSETDGFRYLFTTTPPDPRAWFALLADNIRGLESGSAVTPADIEFPLNAAVIQFNRLGLKTVESCKGFHRRCRPFEKKEAYIKFLTWRDAMIAETMLKSKAYACSLDRCKRLYIEEDLVEILELGLWLSTVQSAHAFRKPLLMKRENRLLQLLDLPGSTGSEDLVGQHLMLILKNRLDSVWMDDTGNVLGELINSRNATNLPVILLSAHQDVYDDSGVGKDIIRNGNTLRRDGGILGADDRAGIAAVINAVDLLKKHNIPCHLKFAFTVREEKGLKGAEHINESFFDGVSFGISMDRRGRNNIVYRSQNDLYCEKNQTNFIQRLSRNLWNDRELHYNAAEGRRSDLRVWSRLGIPSVNLSIGYYNEHTENETLNLDEWHRAQDLLLEMISVISERGNA